MTYVVLDTNFILSCVKKKIDFFTEIPFKGLKIIIPIQVLDELRNISSEGKGRFRDDAKIGLKILENKEFKRIDLHMKNVDNGIVKLASNHKEYVIATLDNGIKNRIRNKKLVIRGETQLEII